MYTRIVVPLDGSAWGEAALPHALELSRKLDVPLHLIRIVDSGPVGPFGTFSFPADYPPFERILNEEQEESSHYLSGLEARIRQEGHQVTSETRVGVVARELLALAQPGDLYVVASHGRGGMTRWFMGSVAEELTRCSTVPVLLVRSSAGDDREQERSGHRDAVNGHETRSA